MLAKKSPLVLESFFVLENKYMFIPPNMEAQDVQMDLFDKYSIDIDFTSRIVSSEGDKTIVFDTFTKIGINQSKQPVGGYSLFIEGVGRYSLAKEMVPEQEIENLKNLSSLTISLGLLRGILMDITSNGPMGKYILPSVAVYDLVKQKAKKSTRKLKGKIAS